MPPVAAWTPWLAALLLASLGSIAATRALYGRWRRRRRLRGQVLDAQASERAATRLLQRAGYEIEATQVTRDWTLWANGQPLQVRVRADLLLRRGGLRYVADVKLGQQASQLRTIATRRQLLEYRIAYEVDGVVLIDMARENIVEVEFALPNPSPPRVWSQYSASLAWLIALLASTMAALQWWQAP